MQQRRTHHDRTPTLSPATTLIEVMIAVGIMTLVLTAIMAGFTNSLRATSQARARLAATKLTQEGMEYYRQMRDLLGWTAFTAAVSTTTQDACLNTTTVPTSTPITWTAPTYNASCPAIGPGTLFTRKATITEDTTVPPAFVAVKIVTTWVDEGITSKSEMVQVFRKPQ